jgi:hypothetical protein
MKFNIHSLLCNNGKQFTHSAATGELINSEILLSPLAVMTSAQKPAKLVDAPNHNCTIALILNFNFTHTKIAAAFKNVAIKSFWRIVNVQSIK